MIVYFDTSALLPLYVHDPASRAARRVRRRATRVATSYLAFAEALAALHRLENDGHLSAVSRARAAANLEADWPAFLRVRLDSRQLPEVRRCLRLHRLTGADAVHLSAAWVVRRVTLNTGEPFRFACADRVLAAAAADDGLELAWRMR